ncbi:MAG: 50S ribosomal protein L9, partial [Oscillospiraceae bacterium]|nr:50S ribosomal protein L9 [Oscillospiraceae bacterium]
DVESAKARDVGCKLEGQSVVVKAKAGQNNRLFGTVTSKEVSAAIKQSLGLDVDKKKINIAMKIEGFGDYSAEARLYAGVKAKFTVSVKEDA